MKKVVSGIYRHYKDKLYLVISVATHSETEERLVVYRALYGDYGLWVRPEKMFLETVNAPEFKYKGPRFKLVKKL